MKEKAVALLSGGLDSTVALLMARDTYEVDCALTFDYGQRAATREIAAAGALCSRLTIRHLVIDLPWLAEITGTALVNRQAEVPLLDEASLDDMGIAGESARLVWVPNRNGLMINIAACFADTSDYRAIVVGFNAEEGKTFIDNTQESIDAITRSLAFTTITAPRVISPTVTMTKKMIAREAHKRRMKEFWSCYLGGTLMCGRCESCMRTIRAFREAGHMADIASLFQEDTNR